MQLGLDVASVLWVLGNFDYLTGPHHNWQKRLLMMSRYLFAVQFLCKAYILSEARCPLPKVHSAKAQESTSAVCAKNSSKIILTNEYF